MVTVGAGLAVLALGMHWPRQSASVIDEAFVNAREEALFAFSDVAGATTEPKDTLVQKSSYTVKELTPLWLSVQETLVSTNQDGLQLLLNDRNPGLAATTSTLRDVRWNDLEKIVVEPEPLLKAGFRIRWAFKSDSILESVRLTINRDLVDKSKPPTVVETDGTSSEFKVLVRSKASARRFLDRIEPILAIAKPGLKVDRSPLN